MDYETFVYHLTQAYGDKIKHVKNCVERLSITYNIPKNELITILLSNDEVLRRLPKQSLNQIFFDIDRSKLSEFARHKPPRGKVGDVKDLAKDTLSKKEEKLIRDIAKGLPKIYKKIRKERRKEKPSKRASNQSDLYTAALKELFNLLAKVTLAKYMLSYNNKMARTLHYSTIYQFLPRQRMIINQINDILCEYDETQCYQNWLAQRLSFFIRFMREAVTPKQRKEIYDNAKKLSK